MKVEIYKKAIERLAKRYDGMQISRNTALDAVIEVAIQDHDCGFLDDRGYAKIIKMAADAMYPEEDSDE